MVMADLLADFKKGAGKACGIVPKLDLMDQLADLLEEMLSLRISRVGTGWPADLSADVFVCVRNSAWQLQNVTLDLQILDEAHHYEPLPPGTIMGNESPHPDGVHATQVLGLNAKKRIFFSATLRRNKADYEFGLRPAIDAGIITDYTIMVPVLSEGDPRPGLVDIIQSLPMSRKILAFCNTVDEARGFTRLLNQQGIPADHYNSQTARPRRQEILSSFTRSTVRGGIRVLVTVDVLSEGVDLPFADTCLFVAPRHGVRLRQCVGRVLRKQDQKVDALVIAPPVVRDEKGIMTEDGELGRLLVELAQADKLLKTSLHHNLKDSTVRAPARIFEYSEYTRGNCGVHEEVGQLLQVHIFPRVLTLGSLDSIWFGKLAAYKSEYGDIRVPYNFKTTDGRALGRWVSVQRAHKARGKLCPERVGRLDALGMVWDPLLEDWEDKLGKLVLYKSEHGDIRVPFTFKTTDGRALGTWVSLQRRHKARGKLCPERVGRLDALGMVWDPLLEDWEDKLDKLVAYKSEHGHVRVHQHFKTAGGCALGRWVALQRDQKARGKLCPERVGRLDALGMVWNPFIEDWEDKLGKLAAYKSEHGNVRVPFDFKTTDGCALGGWVHMQRQQKAKGKLSPECVGRLDALGMVWNPFMEDWEDKLGKLAAYKSEHGDVRVPFDFKTTDGCALGNWVCKQRQQKEKGKLSPECVGRLDALGMVWNPFMEDWEDKLGKLAAYKSEHGDVRVPFDFKTTDGCALGRWVQTQRRQKGMGKLSPECMCCLDALGMVWNPLMEDWEDKLGKLAAYKSEHGNVRVPFDFKTTDGCALGNWVYKQRQQKAKGKLSPECVGRLDALGMVWNPFMEDWEDKLGKLAAYKSEHGDVRVPFDFKTTDGCALGRWVYKQRQQKAKGRLSPECVGRLDALGIVWNPLMEDWEDKLGKLVASKSENGHVRVHQHFKTADGCALGRWVALQRDQKARGKLCPERVGHLDALGMVWDPLLEDWEDKLGKLAAYKSEHGDVRVPFDFKTTDGCALGGWVHKQRQQRAKGKLRPECVGRLDALGMVWPFAGGQGKKVRHVE